MTSGECAADPGVVGTLRNNPTRRREEMHRIVKLEHASWTGQVFDVSRQLKQTVQECSSVFRFVDRAVDGKPSDHGAI